MQTYKERIVNVMIIRLYDKKSGRNKSSRCYHMCYSNFCLLSISMKNPEININNVHVTPLFLLFAKLKSASSLSLYITLR